MPIWSLAALSESAIDIGISHLKSVRSSPKNTDLQSYAPRTFQCKSAREHLTAKSLLAFYHLFKKTPNI
jgi:hypothetical protein